MTLPRLINNAPQTLLLVGGTLPSRLLTTLQRNLIRVLTSDQEEPSYVLLLGETRQILAQLKERRPNTNCPIFCGGRNLSSFERAEFWKQGADGVLCIDQISAEEFAAQLQAVTRRAGYRPTATIEAPLCLQSNNMLRFHGTEVKLTRMEADMMRLFLDHSGKTLTKDFILEALYGGRDEPTAKIIDVFVCKLRKHMMVLGCPNSTIETVWARGYQFNPPPHPLPLAA